jgi:hypothetical protein
MKFEDGRLWNTARFPVVALDTSEEQDVFDAINFPFIDPTQRTKEWIEKITTPPWGQHL